MSECVSCNLRSCSSGPYSCASLCCRTRVTSKHEFQPGSCVFSSLWSPCRSFRGSLSLYNLPNVSWSRAIHTWCTTLLPVTLIRMSFLTLIRTSCLTLIRTSCLASTRMSSLVWNSCYRRMMVTNVLSMSFRWILTCLRRSKNSRQMNHGLSLSRSFLLKNRILSFLGELRPKRQAPSRRG